MSTEDRQAGDANPMQPFVLQNGVVRFKANAIVHYLLNAAGQGRKVDLNDLAVMDFSQDDRCQFAQLIGYSLCGYHELSYVSDEHAAAASTAVRQTFPGVGGCRDNGCEIHCGVDREP